MLSWEEALASLEVRTILLQGVEKFTKDDSSRPDVDLLSIVLFHENKLWRSVKPCRYMACKLTLHYLPQLSGLVKNWRDLTPVQLSYIKSCIVLLRLESIDYIARRGRCFWCYWVYSTSFYRRHHLYIIHVDSKIWSLMRFLFLLDCCLSCILNTLRRGAINVLATIWWLCT